MKNIIAAILTIIAVNVQAMSIEMTPPPIAFDDVKRVWAQLKSDVGAPSDFPPPPIVLDWEVPPYAWMGFQFPTPEKPGYRMQISIAPRTIDTMEREMITWGIAHELTHYLFVLRENDWDLNRRVYIVKLKHHCDREFIKVTRNAADEIWRIYHSDTLRNKMYDEAKKACERRPDQ